MPSVLITRTPMQYLGAVSERYCKPRAMAALDPHTTTPSQLPREWKQEISVLMQEIANTGNRIGRSCPSLTDEEKHRINQFYSDKAFNPARLPDELTMSALQQVGALVHLLGEIADTDLVTPAVVAPLARSVVEQCSLVLFLTSEHDMTLCVAKTAGALRKAIEAEDAAQDNDNIKSLVANCEKFTERYRKERTLKKYSLPKGASELVEDQLSDFDGKDLYKELCGYTHQNSFNALFSTVAVVHNPTQLELQSLEYCTSITGIFMYTVKNLEPFRDAIETAPHFEYLASLCQSLHLQSKRLDHFADDFAPTQNG